MASAERTENFDVEIEKIYLKTHEEQALVNL